MSKNPNSTDPEENDSDAHLSEEDIVEVHEDSGDEPMEDDDDNAGYDGESVIGGPGSGEEGMEGQEEEGKVEDNSWGVSGELLLPRTPYADDGIRGSDTVSSSVTDDLCTTANHEPQQSIFSLALHPTFPNPPLAVTGGEDDLAYIFSPIPDSSSFSSFGGRLPLTKLTGHTDSVVATGWNFDGDMVATGGMDGRVRVWRRARSRRNSRDGEGKVGGDAEWTDWEFSTSLETGSEVQVS